MGDFNRGSTGPGRGRSLARMPEVSTGEGASGNVIPRGTTKASVRRGQSLLRILNDRLPDGVEFSRGSNKGGRRRNFSLMAEIANASTATGVQVTRGTSSAVTGIPVDWTAEVYDYGDWWTSGATLTCPTAGTYDITYLLDVLYGPGGLTMDVYVNGSSVDSQFFPNGTTPITKTVTVALSAGDTIYLQFVSAVTTVVQAGSLTIG